MTIDFSDYFWQGDSQKTSGIDVLFQNLKYGITTTKEFSDFLRERSSVEDSHSKALLKLAKIAANGCPHGSFAPLWQIIKSSSEKLSNATVQMVQKMEELVKEISKYSEELQKKHKSVKDEEAATIEAVQQYQNSKSMVSKTKAVYVQRYLELEKCQKENSSPKDIEKSEIKFKKAQEEYKSWVEKYNTYYQDYLTKFSKACQRFQQLEVVYLKQMKDFMENYAGVVENNQETISQVNIEFRDMCSKTTMDDLLMKFVTQKSTGRDRPVMLEVEEMTPAADIISRGSASSEDKSSTDKAPSSNEKKREGINNYDSFNEDVRSTRGSRRTNSLLNLFIPLSHQGVKNSNANKGMDFPRLDLSKLGQIQSTNSNHNATRASPISSTKGAKWFLRSRRAKKKDKKKGKDGSDPDGKNDKSDGEESQMSNAPTVPTAEVDAEGFSVRPQASWGEEKNNFYSDSDSDSDEEPEKKLHVEIKPLTNGTVPLSASVDELRSTVENLTLSPVGLIGRKTTTDRDSQMKRSQSVSQQIGNSSPPPRHPYAPLSPPILPVNAAATLGTSPQQNMNMNNTSRYADLADIFAEIGEMQPSLPSKSPASRNTPTLTGAIPRPSSRTRQEIAFNRNTNSPSPVVSRTESVSSLETKSIGGYVQGSRGPSPLTLGMTDAIPLAVAFHEIVHAYFKGNDENKCQVKMTGDMMVSFPAGIMQVFANNPSPALLKFKVKSKQSLENLVSNKDLVQVDQVGDELTFEFHMSALIALLKTHAEKNPGAAYFNIDIFKYQIKAKPGATSCPLHLVAFWKCEKSQTDLRIDYKFNSHALDSSESPLTTQLNDDAASAMQLVAVCVAAPVDGGVKSMQSKPTGQWFPTTNRSCWKIPNLSLKAENLGVGSLRARFEVSGGPSAKGTIAAQFSCESTTLSGSEFELLGSGYRVSLVKKRFVSGKYICDAEDSLNRYSSPSECSLSNNIP